MDAPCPGTLCNLYSSYSPAERQSPNAIAGLGQFDLDLDWGAAKMHSRPLPQMEPKQSDTPSSTPYFCPSCFQLGADCCWY